jgi:hypothetical protein
MAAREEAFDLLLGVRGQADDAGSHRRSGYQKLPSPPWGERVRERGKERRSPAEISRRG